MALVFPFAGMALTLVGALDSVIGPVPARLVGAVISFVAGRNGHRRCPPGVARSEGG